MTFILGLDGGGSKTIAATADRRGAVLRRWEGPSLDPQRMPDWQHILTGAITELCDGNMPEAAVLGLPMHGEIEALSREQRDVAAAIFSAPHLVLNDVEVAYDGAFTGKSGVLLLSGTGSMAWAKAGDESLRVGGWGDAFGDEGSAFWIGREALSLASRALDGRLDAEEFAAGILTACGCSADKLVTWAYGQQNFRAAVGGLARDVDRMAVEGDPTAIGLLEAAAAMLADHVDAARERLADPFLGWSHAGSVFGSRALMDRLERRLGVPLAPALPPVGGAIWRAAGLAGWPKDSSFTSILSVCLNHNNRRTAS